MADRPVQELIGQSDAFLDTLDRVSQVAVVDRPVVIIGERGSGKELIAERIHFLSTRWQKPLIKLNCAALNESLLESELFGHEAGAFTGAKGRHQGRFERADGGTLFLDELANTPLSVQEKLLRVLEYGEFERVGGDTAISVDVRLVAATNEDLPALATAGKFRADLLDRLAFEVITIPPLRQRAEDILPLAEFYALRMTKQLGRELFAGFTQYAANQLMGYHWPGNVRELKNVIERSLYRHVVVDEPLHQIYLDPFDSPYRPDASSHRQTQSRSPSSESSASQTATRPRLPVSFKDVIASHEQALLQHALEAAQFNQRKAADLLELTYHQFRGILKKYGMIGEAG